MTTLRSSAAAVAAAILPALAGAQTDTTIHVTFGGFVDSYYAYDFNRPPTFDRAYATQPARHNEFNVNLAFVDATLAASRVRGRFAAQYGTSVQSNYFGEPRLGVISGPDVSRFIQEAYAGYRIGRAVWIDAGIFFANAGMEGWISRDNPSYTRSLVADYSPYYSSGARLTWQTTSRLTARLDVINGWQNISETNSDKGGGLRLDFAATPAATISYYNFFGNEVGRFRTFNGVGTKATLGKVQVLGEIDYGTQDRATGSGSSSWYGGTLVGRFQVTPATAIAARVERYDDRDGVILNTGLTSPGGAYLPFRANGGSIGFDIAPQARVLWRTEVRGFSGSEPVFPDRDAGLAKSSAFVVTSMALTF
jgi:putative OmpL-like beta-barrel porin-2